MFSSWLVAFGDGSCFVGTACDTAILLQRHDYGYAWLVSEMPDFANFRIFYPLFYSQETREKRSPAFLRNSIHHLAAIRRIGPAKREQCKSKL